MVTIGFSTRVPETDETVAEKPKKQIPLIAVPITLCVGLAVALGYVGVRVFAASPKATVVVAKSSSTVPAVRPEVQPPITINTADAAAVAPPAAVAPRKIDTSLATPLPESKPLVTDEAADVVAANTVDMISPQHGQRYLQIAAINDRVVPKFLADVSRYNVQANVAPGPHEGLVRVVIGPFPDRESVERAKAQLQINWPDCFIRQY